MTTRVNFPHSFGPLKAKYLKLSMITWLEENVGPKHPTDPKNKLWIIHWFQQDRYIEFVNAEDALAFKLRFQI